jgi:serine/threonine protein kinase
MPLQRFSKELDMWKRLSHPNITPFIGVTACRGPLPVLLLPYYKNGNVVAYLAKNPGADVFRLVRHFV